LRAGSVSAGFDLPRLNLSRFDALGDTRRSAWLRALRGTPATSRRICWRVVAWRWRLNFRGAIRAGS
jgi:hypothetical protein